MSNLLIFIIAVNEEIKITENSTKEEVRENMRKLERVYKKMCQEEQSYTLKANTQTKYTSNISKGKTMTKDSFLSSGSRRSSLSKVNKFSLISVESS